LSVLVSCYRPSTLKQLNYRRPDKARSDNAISAGQGERGSWHSIDDRARAILNDCASTHGANRAKSFRAIAPHAGKNNSDEIGAEDRCSTDEKRICRWADAADRRTRIRAYDDACSIAND
jgi:hypothetical protein